MSSMRDLREHLFDTIRQLKAGSIDNPTASSICPVAARLLDSAEIELKLRQMTGDYQTGTGFLIDVTPTDTAQPQIVAPPGQPKAASPLKVRRMTGVYGGGGAD
jgi:hypothetical protein